MNSCFVMMPFGSAYDEYYSKIYLPAIESNNYISKRADSLYRPSPILNDIWEFINESKIVIADITGRNPNVMYELGLAHALSKPAIIISDNIDDIPFDLRALRILLYNVKKPNWANDLKNAIEISIKEITESPLEAILPTFIKVNSSKQQEVSEITRNLVELKQYLYRIHSLVERNSDVFKVASILVDTSILNKEKYSEAVQKARKLYFEDGLDAPNIKKLIVKEYNTNLETATDILDIARRV